MTFLSNGSSHHDMALMKVNLEPGFIRDGKKGRGTVPGLNHLGWELETEKDLVEAHGRALSAEIDITRAWDHGLAHSVYLFDPEDNFQEFYADVLTDWKDYYRDENKHVSSRWDPAAKAPLTTTHYTADFVPEFVEGAPAQPREITRATIATRNFEAVLGFYRDVAGLSVIHHDAGRRMAVCAGTTGKPALSLFAAEDGEATGLHHLSFELASETEWGKLPGDLSRIGAVPVETTDGPGKKGLVLRSPDGLLVELYLPLPGRPWSPDDARAPRDLFIA